MKALGEWGKWQAGDDVAGRATGVESARRRLSRRLLQDILLSDVGYLLDCGHSLDMLSPDGGNPSVQEHACDIAVSS